MTLAEFALLLDVPTKWVLNAAASLGSDVSYTLPTARRLAVTRELQKALGIPLVKAFVLAAAMLRRYRGGPAPVSFALDPAPSVELTVDVRRILAAVHTRHSQVRTMHAPRQRGRAPHPRRDVLAAAKAHGIDLTLLAANLQRTPAERLRQLDNMTDFRRRVARVEEP